MTYIKCPKEKETKQNQAMMLRDTYLGDKTIKESKDVIALKIRTMAGSVWEGVKDRSL